MEVMSWHMYLVMSVSIAELALQYVLLNVFQKVQSIMK